MDKAIKGMPGISLQGEVNIPASKSHTIRALLIASLAKGSSRLYNPLVSQDSLSCQAACRQLGAKIQEMEDHWLIEGTSGQVNAPQEIIDVGNSGTTLYLATALAALSEDFISFDGDEQIRNRSALPLLEALTDLGAQIESSTSPQGLEGCAPYRVKGPLKGGNSSLECPTSQYLSALLLAAPLMKDGRSCQLEIPLLFEQPYVEMTLQWLREQQIQIQQDNYERFKISGGQSYQGFDKRIPGDYSSATFFFCAAALSGSSLKIKGLIRKDSQGDSHVLDLLQEMGCTVEWNEDELNICGGELKGISMDLNAMPDALPALAVTACFAQGETRIHNVPQARMKETDRIACMTKELRKMGAEIEETPDGMIIQGKGSLKGAAVKGWGDHRIVMSLSLAAMAAEGESIIEGSEAAEVTFPEFFDLLNSIIPEGIL